MLNNHELSVQPVSCAVLVVSCDAYRDLWTPFFTLFWRYWPDCPFPVYLGANQARFEHLRVTTLCAGDHEWSQRLRTHLDQIHAEYILLLLEDYFFTEPISTFEISASLSSLQRLEGTVLRLYPRPKPDRELEGESNIGQIDRHALYRVSTQAAIWNKRRLSDLLQDDESIWEFEWKGSRRSHVQPQGFYSTYRALMPYRRVIERGRWFPSEAKYFERQQIGCDFEARQVMSWATEVRKAITGNSKSLLDLVVPGRLRFRV